MGEHGLLLDTATGSSEADTPHPGKRELDTQDDLPLAKVFRPMRTVLSHAEQEQPQVPQQQQLQPMQQHAQQQQQQQRQLTQLTSQAASAASLDAFNFPGHPQGQAKVASCFEMAAATQCAAATRQDSAATASAWLSTPRKQLQPVQKVALIASDRIATPERTATLYGGTHIGQN